MKNKKVNTLNHLIYYNNNYRRSSYTEHVILLILHPRYRLVHEMRLSCHRGWFLKIKKLRLLRKEFLSCLVEIILEDTAEKCHKFSILQKKLTNEKNNLNLIKKK